MTNVVAILGSLGGVVAALGCVLVIGRGIFRQVSATEDNTEATKALTGRVDALFHQLTDHETRLRVLEDRIKRPR